MRPLFTVVVPTVGRWSLPNTLASIPRDVAEVIVVQDAHCLPLTDIEAVARGYGARFYALDAGYHDWGSPQLQLGYERAEGEWIMNLGDDDVYEPFAFQAIWRAIRSLDAPAPLMFRTVLHPAPQRGNEVPVVLWHRPELVDKGVTGQCFVVPNDKARLGRWDISMDFGFITSTVDLYGGRVEWRTEVISQCY